MNGPVDFESAGFCVCTFLFAKYQAMDISHEVIY